MGDKLLTVSEVAERLRISEQTVRDWLRRGRLHGIKPGGAKIGWRIPEKAVDRFLEDLGERPE